MPAQRPSAARQRGLRLRDDDLRDRLRDTVERALADIGPSLDLSEPPSLQDADGLLQLALELVAERLKSVTSGSGDSAAADLCERVGDLSRVQGELHAFRTDQRMAALASVRDGLSRLRGIVPVQQMLEKATEEVCRSCGFDRAMLFRLDGHRLIPESAHVQGDAPAFRALLGAARAEPLELTPEVAEAEVLRRKIPMLVDRPPDAEGRAAAFLGQLTGATSYAVAPIAPDDRVVGVIYGDADVSGRAIGSIDRDVLWAFAEGFGYALERSALRQRLRLHRRKMGELAASSQKALDELCETQVAISGWPDAIGPPAASGSSLAVHAGPVSALSPRELDVMELLATGATNAAIAQRLVVSEDTVKSHVRHILRKLNAGNRLEAVARFTGRSA